MEVKKSIYTRQFVWMLFVLFTSFSVVRIPSLLISIAQRDCWLSIVFAWTLDVIFGIVYAYMGVRFKDQSLVQQGITLWGKYFGKIPGVFLIIFFLIFCCILQRSLSIIINKMILPRTPYEIVLFITLAIAAYSAKKGLKVLGRVCEILGPLFFISLITLIVFVVPKIKINNLKPQFFSGFFPIFKGTFFILCYLGICIIMTMYIPANDKPENGFLAKAIASSLGSFIILIFVISIIGIFGIAQGQQMFYAGLELARFIALGSFFERVESIWIIITITASIISASTLIWACSIGLSQMINIKNNNSLINSIALLVLILSITSFNSKVDLYYFSLYVIPIFPVIVTIFQFLLLFTALITKKRVN